ncbi:unnamed protein product [Hymenolepis diminuta]|uniref:Uncharacterized protein n=1 Tax=Hymenolepis diminuta TaxID=6216 RepID=A0A564Z1H5_HYMDI|nr:unnamed protein product [Hymenolepis diminuta]
MIMTDLLFGSDVCILLPVEEATPPVDYLPKKRKMPNWLQVDRKPSPKEVCISGEQLLLESSIPSHRQEALQMLKHK